MTVVTPTPRFGGELPAGVDAMRAAPEPFPPRALLFSHGRAALGWLIRRRGPFDRALVCAYTCPTVPAYLEQQGLNVELFDVLADREQIGKAASARSGRTLILAPTLFGFAPWIDAVALASDFGERGMVVVDAAQTAFGHIDFQPPPGGAVLSCPRKATAIGDGAVLILDGADEADVTAVAALPAALQSAEIKRRGRRLFACGLKHEAEALALVRAAEKLLPGSPHRISDESRDELSRIDRTAHAEIRKCNHKRLMQRLGDALPAAYLGEGTPFAHPILFSGDRSAFLGRLHQRRVFATPLWPDARHDPVRHPIADRFAKELVLLPIDQRYGVADMDRLAELVLASR